MSPPLTDVWAVTLQTAGELAAERGDLANDWLYVVASYGVTIGVIAAYATWTVRRGRKAGRQLPAHDRRWM
ncbi:hypothetical protein BH23ACT2_BH23ACT2_00510 [soil metagenome]